jgi:hypothetical protein
MAVITNLQGADNFVLQEAISAYTDEAYTNAKKLTGTGIVGTNAQIDTNTETYIGQIRWEKPLHANINIASLTDPTSGTPTTTAMDYLKYIKTVRTHGAHKVNVQEIITQRDGLAKIGRDFGETRGQDEHNSILAILKGVALSEVLLGAGSASGHAGLGGQTFDNDPTDNKYGFYVDLGADTVITAAAIANQGANRATGFLNAVGAAYKDYEPEYFYLVVSPEVMASLRSANLMDEVVVTEGNMNFSTIFSGKFRLIQTRAQQGFTTAQMTKLATGAGVDIVGSKVSFICTPAAIAQAGLNVPVPVEIYRRADTYQGGGETSIWYRWGNVYAPNGYSWAGSESVFPADADYMGVNTYGSNGTVTRGAIEAATDNLAGVTGAWTRKATSALSLGILPVFHA